MLQLFCKHKHIDYRYQDVMIEKLSWEHPGTRQSLISDMFIPCSSGDLKVGFDQGNTYRVSCLTGPAQKSSNYGKPRLGVSRTT